MHGESNLGFIEYNARRCATDTNILTDDRAISVAMPHANMKKLSFPVYVTA
jgi:hypothetical protein